MLQHISIFKIFIWMICASVSVSTISAQQINVEKFIFLENDLDARVTNPKKDQNNEVCALIKVVTKHTGFSFDIGSLGVVASEQKTGEIWVYIPRGAQKITIKHAQLGVLRNYIFPMPIESANVYEMLLTTADVEIVVKEKIIETQWLVINTEPSGANVFINDDYLGKTPYQGQLPAGDYNYRIENPQYHTQAGKIKITDKKEVLNFNLKANFGNVTISSLPEAGMQIYLNNQNTGKTTPATLPKINSGKHTVKLLNEWYEPIEKEIEVKDEQTTNAPFTMQAVFANIKIKTNANASIEINGVKRAEGEFNDRLRKGIYSVKLKHEQYYEQEFQLIVEANKNQELSYELKPKTGTLEIVTTPFDATLLLNNKNYGTSPNSIKNLLIGKYTLKIQKEGYKEVQQKIEIKENEITKLEFTLELNNFVSNNKSSLGIQYGKGVTDINGNTYKTVIIGKQEWMAENLKVNKYNNGTSIPNVTDANQWQNLTTGAWCNYDNNTQNENLYGKLYNWYAVNTGKLCPTGWHVPTDAEWIVLTDYLSKNDYSGKEGIALKSTTGWIKNLNGTDKFGFKGLPGGYRDINGKYIYIDYLCYWWSSSEYNEDLAKGLELNPVEVKVYSYSRYKIDGYNVRCLKNYNEETAFKETLYNDEIIYKIGQKGPAGGLVFYDKGNYDGGWRYLEVAPRDQGIFVWGCNGTFIPNTQTVVGSGKQNTAKIIAGCKESNIAAKICDDLILGGKDDWFLPSIDELELMHKNLHENNLGNFKNSSYWSSSENYAGNPWSFAFDNGYAFNYYKYLTSYVRAVRAF